MRILILGAGGHGQVVADILARAAEAGAPAQAVGFLDDSPALQGAAPLGLPVLGPLSALASVPHDAVMLAFGDNRRRRRLFEQLSARGEHFVLAKHPTAIIAPDVQLGPGTMICAGVIVNPGSVIGANVILNTGCTVDHHNRIGNHVHIAPGSHLGGEVEIGVGALVGIGATVMPRRQIGPWAVLGASALASRDLDGYAIAVGVPARVIATQPQQEE